MVDDNKNEIKMTTSKDDPIEIIILLHPKLIISKFYINVSLFSISSSSRISLFIFNDCIECSFSSDQILGLNRWISIIDDPIMFCPSIK